MSSYICLTAEEWRNLCSMGRIRLHESKAVSDPDQLGPSSYQALFSMAPHRFSLGETSDFLITECKNLQLEIEGVRPPGYELGVRWLLLEDVIRFFPLRADDAWAFESDAKKAQVVLGNAAFESHWEQWFKEQSVDQACINGLTLMRALGLGCSPKAGTDESGWRALAEQIANPNPDDTDIAEFSVKIVKDRDLLFNLVREDSDSGAFFVSCPIEWINLQSDGDLLDSDTDLADLAHRLYNKYRTLPFEPSLARADDLTEFANLLCARAPEAFPNMWAPAAVSLYVRYSHRIRFGFVLPEDVIAAIRAICTDDSHQPAAMVAFLLGISLGTNKTHTLDRLLHHQRFDCVNLPSASKPHATPLVNIQDTILRTDPLILTDVALADVSELPTHVTPNVSPNAPSIISMTATEESIFSKTPWVTESTPETPE